MDENQYRASRLLKVLANPLAYQIVTLLRTGPARPVALAGSLGRPSASISRVGRELKMTDIVYFQTWGTGAGGRIVEYRLKDRSIEAIMGAAESYVERIREI